MQLCMLDICNILLTVTGAYLAYYLQFQAIKCECLIEITQFSNTHVMQMNCRTRAQNWKSKTFKDKLENTDAKTLMLKFLYKA